MSRQEETALDFYYVYPYSHTTKLDHGEVLDFYVMLK